ncbi:MULTISPECIES: agmatine deiminase family protein [unclassified Halomonas]|uniref:agmatine deiminase family protein n=1 Tax=unclassified Halomonas TaxID=2609666 RepID=UPI0006D9AA18|nr:MULTISPECIES: agmatine deiminase family protein [unclassified Halomonas]KPQ22782.1 MAG: agmatine deiminase [Halomonas sp. HL-93]SBR49563.1 agmatine deiminase [Halomonas sp. HL-93]SNY96431.1 agmatine deiminase [Halomonas sp. hl-4]
MTTSTYRLLPEWHPQDGIQLTWPRPDGDWQALLECIEGTLERIVVAVTRYQRVIISVPDAAIRARLTATFDAYGVPEGQILLRVAPTNDTWARDHGPITVADEEGRLQLLDYTFTGWGGKFPANQDNRLTQRLAESGLWNCPVSTRDLVLEGGAIETDGEGTLLTTEACLLNPNRNPQMTRRTLEAQLYQDMGIDRVLWLTQGYLEGDDTDSHIDTLARFCNPGTIAYVRCDDPTDPHFDALQAMEQELQAFRKRNGEPYQLVPLPWPNACYAPDDGRRLPATYANFLIINGAVLVPTYGDPADVIALQALAAAFPEHTLIPIECSHVIRQHGSLHCLTMQLPRGTLAVAHPPDMESSCQVL